MDITITWKDITGLVFEIQDTTLAQFFEDNPNHAAGSRTAIREEIVRDGVHIWASTVIAEVRRKK